MFGKLDDLPHASSISGPSDGITEFELEQRISLQLLKHPWVGEVPVPTETRRTDEVVFVCQLCESVVVCVGRVLKYEESEFGEGFARLVMEGVTVSFNPGGES